MTYTIFALCRVLYSYLKPESVRMHPEATVRPWATCQVVGDALSFASALGYVCVTYLVTVIVYMLRLSTDEGRRFTSVATSFEGAHL